MWTIAEKWELFVKIDFNTNTRIGLAVLKRFGDHKTNFQYKKLQLIIHRFF